MAVSASQLSEFFKSVFPSDRSQMDLRPIMVPSGRIRYAGDEIIGYGESGPMYGPRYEEESDFAGYYSPYLKRNLTADELQHVIPLTEFVEGQGYVNAGVLFPGEKAIDAFNKMGITGSQLSGQPTPGGFQIYPLAGTVATDQGDRTNIAIRYGESGAPEASAYQSSTLFGSAKVDKIVDQLAKAANAALLTSVGGLTLGPLGAGVLSNPAVAGVVAGAGQAAIKGGDTKDLLIGALSGYLQAPGSAEITAASDLAKIEASMGTPGLLGSSNILDAVNQAATYAPEVLSKTLPVTPPVVETISGTLSRDAFSMLNPTERGKYVLDMAVKRIPTDLSFDFNMDGKITPYDALLAAKETPLPSLSTNIPSAVSQASTVAPSVANIAPEVVAANLGALESSLGTVATAPTGVSPSDLAQIEASMGTPGLLGSANVLDTINQAATYAPSVANISPEIAAANLGVLEASIGTPSLPVTQLPTGVSPSDVAVIEASMGPSMQLPQVPGLQGARLEDIFAGFGDYNEAAQNLLGQAQGNLPTITGPTLPTLVNEPVRVPGDTRLVDTIAQPPLSVEDISGQLSPEAKRLMGMMDIAQPGPLLDLPAVGPEQLMPRDVLPDKPTLPDVRQPPDLIGYNEAVGQALADAQNKMIESGVTLGDLTGTAGNLDKGVLLGNEGYGPISDQTITEAPITSSPITSLGPAANLNDVIDYLKGGAFVGSLGDALKEAFKAATGSGQQQQGSGLGGLGPIIGGLLSRAPTAAPSATVTPGRPVDITSPIQSLLAPKLVQQRPVTLL